MRHIFLLIPLLMVIPNAASAKLNIHVEKGHYDLYGKTAKELESEVMRYGPLNGRAIAYTIFSWQAKWTYLTARNECSIKNLNIDLYFEIVYPRRANKDKGSNNLQSSYSKLMAHVNSHQTRYKRKVTNLMKKAYNEVLQLRGYTCKSAENKLYAVRRKYERILFNWKRRFEITSRYGTIGQPKLID
jgi:predicted secreted Zn-dependent protease